MAIDIYGRYVPDGYILVHHGVAGQKWGVRHGPPYPLTGRMSRSHSDKTSSKRNLSTAGLRSPAERADHKRRVAAKKIAKTKYRAEKYDYKRQRALTKQSKMEYKRSKGALKETIVRDNDPSYKAKIEKYESTVRKFNDKRIEAMSKYYKMYSRYVKRYGDIQYDVIDTYKIAKMQSKTANETKNMSKYNRLRLKYDNKRGVGVQRR